MFLPRNAVKTAELILLAAVAIVNLLAATVRTCLLGMLQIASSRGHPMDAIRVEKYSFVGILVKKDVPKIMSALRSA